MRTELFLLVFVLAQIAGAQSITVYPGGAGMPKGTTRQMSAYVPLSPNTVTWSINGVVGGSATYGTVSQTGSYSSPAAIPPDNLITIRVTSTAYPSKVGTAKISITQPLVYIWSASPRTVAPGAVLLSINGAGFVPGVVVTINDQPLTTTYVSATALSVTGNVPASMMGAAKLKAINPGPGSTVSDPVTVTVKASTVSVSVSPASAAVPVGKAQTFTANVPVTWTATVGTITSAGIYTAPATLPSPAIATVIARSVADPTASASATITLSKPPVVDPPVMPNLAHARFLEQAAFGPTAAELQNLGQNGVDAWLAAQFSMSATQIPIPSANSEAQAQYLSRLVHAPDQLRQRVVNALTKIIVVSAEKNPYPNELVPYVQILSKHAFGSYRQLLYDITVSPQMGKYLDLANSKKPAANENYPREMMQLFSTGLVLLNPDGTPKLDAQNKPIASYTQATVAQTALALTGWTYPTAPGGTPNVSNWESFTAPAMEAREQYHDQSAKSLIGGCPITAGLSVSVETNAVIDCVFNHPNTGPFIVTRLIRELVTSHPTPGYVGRVVDVWNSSKGDLKAVVTAILKDPEASAGQGRLKDAIYHVVSFLRAMNGALTPTNQRVWSFTQMGQSPLAAPSVFGNYSLTYRSPSAEFQIYSPTEAMLRGNLFYDLLNNPNQSDMNIDLSPFLALASDRSAVIEKVNATLLYGRMPQPMKDSLSTAMAAASDNNQAVLTALYLTILSGHYSVQF